MYDRVGWIYVGIFNAKAVSNFFEKTLCVRFYLLFAFINIVYMTRCFSTYRIKAERRNMSYRNRCDIFPVSVPWNLGHLALDNKKSACKEHGELANDCSNCTNHTQWNARMIKMKNFIAFTQNGMSPLGTWHLHLALGSGHRLWSASPFRYFL